MGPTLFQTQPWSVEKSNVCVSHGIDLVVSKPRKRQMVTRMPRAVRFCLQVLFFGCTLKRVTKNRREVTDRLTPCLKLNFEWQLLRSSKHGTTWTRLSLARQAPRTTRKFISHFLLSLIDWVPNEAASWLTVHTVWHHEPLLCVCSFDMESFKTKSC